MRFTATGRNLMNSAASSGFGRFASVASGGGAPTVVLAAPFMYDDFAATNTSLTGRAGWNAFGDTAKAALIKADGGVARMTTDFNGGAPAGYQMTAPLPTQDRRVKWSIDISQGFSGTGSADNASFPKQWSDQNIYLAYLDDSNYINIEVEQGTFTDPDYRLYITAVISGSGFKSWRSDRMPAVADYEAEIIGDLIRLRVNGQIIMSTRLTSETENKFPDTQILEPPANSRAGFRHGFYGWNICSGPFTVDVIRTSVNIGSRFYGRDASQGRNVTVSGKYTKISAEPTQWAYRLLDEETGAVVTNWTTWTPTAASAAYSGTIRLAQGGPYVIEVAWTDGINPWYKGKSLGVAVGLLFAGWGQSNSDKAASQGVPNIYSIRGNTGARNYKVYGWSPAANLVPAQFIGDTWRQEAPNDITANLSAREFCRIVSAATGLPVGFGATGVAANALVTLKPGTTNWNTVFLPFITAMGGNIEGFVWTQGEAEALSASDYSGYAADFASLVAGFRGLANRSDAPVFIRMIGDDDNITNTSTTTTRAFEARNVFLALENPGNNIWVASYPIGLAKSDTIHYDNGLSQTNWSRRAAYTVARRMGIGTPLTYDGRGPRVTSATRVGAVITLTLDMNGYTNLTGTALTGYEVSNDDFTTTLTQSSAVVSGSTIVITLSSPPTGTTKVRSFVLANYNDSSLATATLPDGFSIPVAPIISPITAT